MSADYQRGRAAGLREAAKIARGRIIQMRDATDNALDEAACIMDAAATNAEMEEDATEDERPVATGLLPVDALLVHVADHVVKRQFLNASYAAGELTLELLSRFSDVLKGEATP